MPESTPAHDVVFGYDDHDRAAVERLAGLLADQGFRVWLDVWELVPGAPESTSITTAIGSARVFLICLGSTIGSRTEEDLVHARRVHAANEGVGTGLVVLLPGASIEALPATVAGLPQIDLSAGIDLRSARPLIERISAVRRRRATGAGPVDDAHDEPVSLSEVDFTGALVGFDAELAENPENVDALRGRMVANMALGRHEAALEDVDRLLDLSPHDLSLLSQKILILNGLGRVAEVREVAGRFESGAEDLVRTLGESYGELSDEEVRRIGVDLTTVTHTRAYDFLRLVRSVREDRERAVRQVRGEAAALEAQALAQVDPDMSLEAWRRAVALDPGAVAYRFAQFRALAAAGRDEELRGIAEAVDPDDAPPAALLMRALVRLSPETTGETMALLDRAVELEPEDPTLRAVRSDLLVAAGRLEDAAADLAVVLADNPSNWAITQRLMAMYRHLGNLDGEADLMDTIADHREPALRAMFRRSVAADPDGEAKHQALLDRLLAGDEFTEQHKIRAASLRAQARVRDGKSDDAVRIMFGVVTTWPHQHAAWASALAALATAPRAAVDATATEPWIATAWDACRAFAGDDVARARSTLDTLLGERSDDSVLLWLRGVTAVSEGDRKAALEFYERSIAARPQAPVPRIARADVLNDLNRPDDALADYDFVIDELAAAAEPEVLFKRGEARRRTQRYREAIEDFDAALGMVAREPTLRPVLVASRGQAKLGLGDLEGALADLDSGLGDRPDMSWALGTRVFVHLARGDVTAAIADRQALAERSVEDVDAWEAYADLLIDADQTRRACAELETALDAHDVLRQSARLWSQLGRASIGSARFAEAEAAFRQAAELEPAEGWWVYEQARAVRHQGRLADASALVRVAIERLHVPPPPHAGYHGARSNQCLYFLAAGDRDADAVAAWDAHLAHLDDIDVARTGLQELGELEASGFWSEAADRVRLSLREWIASHTEPSVSTAGV